MYGGSSLLTEALKRSATGIRYSLHSLLKVGPQCLNVRTVFTSSINGDGEKKWFHLPNLCVFCANKTCYGLRITSSITTLSKQDSDDCFLPKISTTGRHYLSLVALAVTKNWWESTFWTASLFFSSTNETRNHEHFQKSQCFYRGLICTWKYLCIGSSSVWTVHIFWYQSQTCTLGK